MEDREARAVLEQMAEAVDEFSTAPSFAEMPRRALEDKLAAGPTSAHVIEEVHTPLNVAYVTFTTGSTAFQNIVVHPHPSCFNCYGFMHNSITHKTEEGNTYQKVYNYKIIRHHGKIFFPLLISLGRAIYKLYKPKARITSFHWNI